MAIHASAYVPSRAITPQRAQTIRLSPIEPLLANTPFGEIKIPEPEIYKQAEHKYMHKNIYMTCSPYDLIKTGD